MGEQEGGGGGGIMREGEDLGATRAFWTLVTLGTRVPCSTHTHTHRRQCAALCRDLPIWRGATWRGGKGVGSKD